MSHLPREPNNDHRDVVDGLAWLVIWPILALLLLLVSAAPAHAQTTDDNDLGGDLYPPAGYEADPDDGVYDVSVYDIGCANDGFFGDVACVTVGTATNLVFSLAKLGVAVAVWLLEAATGFVVEDTLADASTSLADLLDQRILGPLQLSHLGLVVSALYMGWQFTRGRIGLGAGEFVLSLVVFAVLVSVSGAGFGTTVTDITRTAGGLSTEVVALAADTDADGNVAGQLGAGLMAGFVRDPYDTINWGRPLQATSCAPARNQVLAAGPHGFDDTPRQTMATAGCRPEAEFNAEASATRLVGALLYLVVAAAGLGLLAVTAFTLVVAKGLALFLIALLPVALYAGLFPGGGRALLWHWTSALIRVVALILIMGVYLALLVAGLNGLLSLPGGLWARFLMVVFFMAIMWVGRRQLVDMSGRFADSTLRRLEAGGIGGAHGASWIRPYQAGGITGLGVTQTIRETRADHPHLATPTTSTIGRAALTGWAKGRQTP